MHTFKNVTYSMAWHGKNLGKSDQRNIKKTTTDRKKDIFSYVDYCSTMILALLVSRASQDILGMRSERKREGVAWQALLSAFVLSCFDLIIRYL
jgi:hypothetical protein